MNFTLPPFHRAAIAGLLVTLLGACSESSHEDVAVNPPVQTPSPTTPITPTTPTTPTIPTTPPNPTTPIPPLLTSSTAIPVGDAVCFNGGKLTQAGTDDNGNGQLDAGEIQTSDTRCNALPELTYARRELTVELPLKTVAVPGGKTLSLSLGVGSGATRRAGDPAGMFWTVSDRGPNIDCGDAEKIVGIKDFCGAGVAGKIFPVPEFAPSIYQWQLEQNSAGDVRMRLVSTITLKDKDGVAITGLSNPYTLTDTEAAFAVDKSALALDPEGLDPEALAVLADGSFWLSEEYAPSLVHVAADGKILERIVPATLEADLAGANYPVKGLLPEILKKRTLNRGFESIGVTPDGKHLYFAIQSPLSNPDEATYKASRQIRLFKAELDNGRFGKLLGEYLYNEDAARTFADGPSNTGDTKTAQSGKQSDVKISEMSVLGEDDLLVLERVTKVTKLYRVGLAGATNVLGSAVDSLGQSPSLEASFDGEGRFSARPVVKQLAFDSLSDAGAFAIPEKVEGISLLDSRNLLLINDNDFAIEGAQTRAIVYPLPSGRLDGAAPKGLKLSMLGRYASGIFDAGGAEIVAWDPVNQRVFVVNAQAAVVDVLDGHDPANLTKLGTLDVGALAAGLGAANSVAVKNDVVAVAIEANPKTDTGKVALYKASDLSLLKVVDVGALPDMLTFTSDGKKILVANEGEPSADYSVDPEGSVSVIDLAGGAANATVTTLGFAEFNVAGARHAELPGGVRVFGPGASVAQDLEPEYIAVSADNSRAWVSLQENNAMAVVDLTTPRIEKILDLGVKDHGVAGNELDASDKDGGNVLKTWKNLFGLYMPDSVASYRVGDEDYLVSANEGDAREYGPYVEAKRVKNLNIDAARFDANIQLDGNLGRLNVTTASGDADNDGVYASLYAFGARSFSIWNPDGKLVFDSGSDFEHLVSERVPANFNASNTKHDRDDRSDDKGPEPEGVALGSIDGRTYAFVGLERQSGIMVYDVSAPRSSQFLHYAENRNYALKPGAGVDAGDLGPEGVSFVPAEKTSNGKPWLLVGNEISGTTTIWQIDVE